MPPSRTTTLDTAESRSRTNTLDLPLLDTDGANIKPRPGGKQAALWPWLVLNYDYIYKNIVNLAAHNLAPFDALAWQAYGMGGLGDLCMSTYFASQDEWAAVRFQVFGTSTSWVIITQMWMAGKCPLPALVSLSLIYGTGLFMAGTKACGIVPKKVFQTWQEFTTPIAMAACCFSLLDSFVFPHEDPADTNPMAVYAGVIGFVSMTVVVLLQPPKLMPVIGSVSAWLATLLFMFMPVAQILAIYKVSADPEKVKKGFSLLAAILGAIGNGLGSVRALHTRDPIWYIGSMWGCLLGGWGCSMVVWIANALDTEILVSLSAFLILWFMFIIKLNGDAHHETLYQQFAFVGNAFKSQDD